ncbi:MAG: NUDIX domain-containing protein [Pseudomonadota bacterium]
MKWRELGRASLYRGFIELIRWRGQFERFDGSWSDPVERELMLRGEAVAVLPIDLRRDSVLLVEQFRAAAVHMPGGAWQVETLAGVVEDGESLEAVARREAREEAGLDLDELVPMVCYQPSPGACDETLHLFLAPTDLGRAGGVFGVAHEHEDIRTLIAPVEAVLSDLDAGRFHNSMTLIALHWLARQRQQGRFRAAQD